MDAMQFIYLYPQLVEEIAVIVHPQFERVIIDMRKLDPHDLVSPETWFNSTTEASGFVWKEFIRRARKQKLTSTEALE